jgi:hypothetical protein
MQVCWFHSCDVRYQATCFPMEFDLMHWLQFSPSIGILNNSTTIHRQRQMVYQYRPCLRYIQNNKNCCLTFDWSTPCTGTSQTLESTNRLLTLTENSFRSSPSNFEAFKCSIHQKGELFDKEWLIVLKPHHHWLLESSILHEVGTCQCPWASILHETTVTFDFKH